MGTSERAAGDIVARAHARLVADSSFQFHPTVITPPKTPDWLPGLAKLFAALAPVLKVVFWVLVAALALYIVIGLARLIVTRSRRRAARSPSGLILGAEPPTLRPSAPRAQALLAEADRLAAEGRFVEAAHVLLFRTIDDIEGRRPRSIRPALTSRDIAALPAIPAPARAAFGLIVERVEHGFFGGRELDRSDFGACRRAYETFADPASWPRGAAA
jgi:hypothetical protein